MFAQDHIPLSLKQAIRRTPPGNNYSKDSLANGLNVMDAAPFSDLGSLGPAAATDLRSSFGK
jgi:hypothetical protein